MRVVLNKGKWFLLALFVFVLPFGVARANSFASQGDTLQCVQVETDTSGDRSGDDYRLATATSTTVECGETSVAGSSLGDRFGDSDISHRLATASTSEPATSEGQDGYCSCIYWDPVNGSDAYNGFYSSEPVKSASMAISWHEQYSEFGDDPIYLMSTGTITANTTWDFGGAPVRAYTSFGNMFEINGAYTLTIKNATLVGPGTSSSYYAVYSSYSGAKVVLENCTFSNFSSDYPISVPSSGTLTEVYWDPTSGVDTNDGSSSSAAVKSAGKAKSLLANVSTGTIYLTSAYTLTASTTWDFGGATVKKTFAGDMFTASSAYTLTISNGKFVGGGTSSQGRAIYTSNSSATIDLTDCTFNNFYKAHADGGAIYTSGTLDIDGCTFTGNHVSANGAGGGAIFCSSTLDVKNCTFKNNYTYSPSTSSGRYSCGGAIFCRSTTNLTDCVFIKNYADGAGDIRQGGAVNASSALNIYGCTFQSNDVGDDTYSVGGAIYCDGALTIQTSGKSNTYFYGNTAKSGGAIYSNGSTATMNCVVWYSTGENLIALAKATTINMQSCHFTNNTVTQTMIYSTASNAKITFSGVATYGGSSEKGNTLNLASGSTGAVICYATGSGSTITINSGTYTYNSGGRLFLAPNGTVTINDGSFYGNSDPADNYLDIYWDPVNGNDSNNGKFTSKPVKTLDRAKKLVTSDDMTIRLVNVLTLASNTTLDFGNKTVVLAKGLTGNGYIYVNGAYALTMKNVTISTETTTASDTTIPVVKGSGSSSTLNLYRVNFQDIYSTNYLLSNFTLGSVAGVEYNNVNATGISDFNYTGVCYWDPTNGDDSNLGIHIGVPVKTYAKAKELAGTDGKILMCGQQSITSSTTMNFEGRTIYLAKGVTDIDAFFYITGAYTVTFTNVTFSTETDVQADVTVPVIKSESDTTLNIKDVYVENYSSYDHFVYFASTSTTYAGNVNVENLNVGEMLGGYTNLSLFYFDRGKSLSIKNSLFDFSDIYTTYAGRCTVKGELETCVIENCTVDGMWTAGDGFVYATIKNLEVNNCTFTRNRASWALITNFGNDSTTTINGCTFGGSAEMQNYCHSVTGGIAGYARGANAKLIINGGEFSYNKGDSLFFLGGNGSSIVINGGNFHHNENKSAVYGGGLYWQKESFFGSIVGIRYCAGSTLFSHDITINDGVFNNNYTICRGGVVANGAGTLVINNGEFCNNVSEDDGGVVYVANRGATAYINGGYFSNNTSPNGGVVYSYRPVYIDSRNSSEDIIFENNIGTSGGGVFAGCAGLTVYIYSGARSTVIFRNNHARSGGVVYGSWGSVKAYGALSNPIVFESNNAIEGYGGVSCTLGACVYKNCTFTGNTATGGGGAIYGYNTDYKPEITLENCTFTNNKSNASGGAVYTVDKVVAKNCTFTNVYTDADGNTVTTNGNTAGTGKPGGAIYCVGGLEIEGCTFIGSSAGGGGGAIYTESTSEVKITNSKFENNSANSGSGGAFYANTSATITLTGCTFSGNVSTGSGGAIYSEGIVKATDCDFTGNSSTGLGASIYAYNKITATDCTFIDEKACSLRSNYDMVLTRCSFSNLEINKSGGVAISCGQNVTATDCTFSNCKSTSVNSEAVLSAWGTITLTNCSFTNNSSAGPDGGAVRSQGWNIIATDCVFDNNSTTGGAGGALYAQKEGRNITVTNCTFTNNTASGSGGAIYSAGAVTATGCTFSYNKSTAIHGGAILANGVVTLTNCDFDNNTADGSGGAVCDLSEPETPGTHTITDCTFTSNTLTTGWGGAFYSVGNMTKLYNSTFTDNKAGVGGGGVYSGNYLYIYDSDFTGNTAKWGGGTFGYYTEIQRCNFESNEATTDSGGAIFSDGNSVQAYDSTFVGNKAATYASAIRSVYIGLIKNCTFTNNNSTAQGEAGSVIYGAQRFALKGCTITGSTGESLVSYDGSDPVTITDCTFQNNTVSVAMVVSIADSASLTFNGGTYGGSSETGNTFDGTTGAVVCYVSGSGATITVNGGEYSYNTGAVLFSAPNGTVTINTIYSHDNSHDNKDTLKRVYWDPTSGNDTYAGTSTSVPVKTWAVVLNKISLDGNGENVVYGSEIYLCGVMTISATTTYDFKNSTIILCKGITGTAFFYVNGAYTLTLQNATITTETTTQSDTTIPVAKGTSSATLTMTNVNFENFYTSANVVDTFSYVPVSNMKAENVQGSANFFYSADTITIGGSSFIEVFVDTIVASGNGTAAMGDTIFKNCGGNHILNSKHQVWIETGTTIDSCYGNSLFWISNCIQINAGTFKNNWSSDPDYGGVLVTVGADSASITVNDGEFSNNKNGSLFLLYGNNSNIDIMDGNFHDNRNEKVQTDTSSTSDFVKNCFYGTIVGTHYNNTHDISIYGGNFYNNYTICNGGVACNGNLGITTISGGRFCNNSSGKNGGAIASWRTAVVTGGYFYKNSSTSAGGALAICGQLTIDSSNSTADIIFRENNYYAVNTWGCPANKIISGTKYTVKFIGNEGAFVTNGSVYINSNATTEVLPVIFQDGFGTRGRAICTTDSYPGVVVAKYCRFENNQSANGHGGAIYGTKTVTLENCTFKGNKAYKNGGAVYSASTCTATNCTFDTNGSTYAIDSNEDYTKRTYGGAIACYAGLTLTNCDFIGNYLSTQSYGGAVYAQGQIDIQDCIFENNKSLAYGGAVQSNSPVIIKSVNRSCKFIGNKSNWFGGAISAYSCTATGTADYPIVFEGNKAYATGGTINCSYEINTTYCEFIDNYTSGGAGAARSEMGNVVAENCVFSGNTAKSKDGGAIFAQTTVKVKNCDFIGNTAGNSGGAIVAKSTVDATNCVFYGNIAGKSCSGGAIYAEKVVTAIDCQFVKNEAGSGGAINTLDSCSVTNCEFVENETYSGNGGSIWCADKIIAENSDFSKNTATGNGGAVYVYYISSEVSEITDCDFIDNYSGYQGGAIFCTVLKLNCKNKSIIFKNNVAKDSGGVLRDDGVEVNGTEAYPVIFDGNSSSSHGGVFWSWYNINAKYCQFLNNISYHGGGVCALIYGKATFNNCTFTNNKQEGGWIGGGVLHKYTASGAATYSENNTYTFTDCDFTDNYATSGGGIFNLGHSSTYYQGTANLSFSGCTFSDSTGADVLEEGQTTKLGDKMKGAIVYVGGKATVNLSGLSFENFETKGVGLFYVASGGTFNYSNSTLYNTRTTYGLIYNLGTANLTNLTIAGCNGSAIGPLYCGGSGVMTVTNLSTYYRPTGVTSWTYGNKNDYGGTLAIGEVYDTEGKALLMSNGNALTVAGGTVEFVSGDIEGDGYVQQTVTAAKKGGGVYAGKGGKFNMYGGKIRANWGGPQLYIEGGEANVYGVNKYDYTNRKVETGAGAMIFHERNGSWSVRVFDAGVLNLLGGYIYMVEVYSGGKMTALGGSTSQMVFNRGSEAKLKNMVIKNGGAGYNYSYNRNHVYSDKVEFINCYMSVVCSYDNKLFDVSSGANLRIKDCVFEGCQAKGTIKSSKDRPSLFRNYGGTIEFEWCEFLNGKDTLFYSNPNYSTSKYIFNNCTVSGNTIEYTSASSSRMIEIWNGSFEMYDTYLKDNGGALYFDPEYSRTITVTMNNLTCDNGFGSINLNHGDSYQISNSTFSNHTGTIQIWRSNGTIEDCSFKDIFGTNIITKTYGDMVIRDCIFENISQINKGDSNSISRAIYTNGTEGSLEIYDSTFRNYAPTYSGTDYSSAINGGAIFIGDSASVTLAGTIRVEGNCVYYPYKAIEADTTRETSPSGGGIYVADGATLNIKQNTLLICKDNYREVEQSDGTTIKYADNLYIASSNKMILEGDLNEGSDFGLGCIDTRDSENQIVLEEKDALLSKGENYPVTNKLLEIASLDNENYELRFVYLKDNKNGLVFYPKERSTYWLLCNDLVVDYDPAKTQTINTPTLMWGDIEYTEDYRIKYLNENGEYKLDKPTFSEIGSYAVQYIVECLNEKLEWTTLTVDGVAMTGKTYLRILGTRLILEENPVAHLDYGKTLAYAKFYGGVVKDAEGQTVTGVWEFVNSDTVGENGKSYVAKFTPSNTINVMESSIQMLQNVSVEVQTLYPYVFYQKGYFRTKLNGDSSTIINITDLQTMVDNMPDNGTLVFCETYTISTNQTIEVKDKSINFVRYRLFKYSIDSSGNYSSTGDPMPMIAVDGVDASLTLKGNIYFEGLAPYSGWWNFNTSSESDSLSHIKNYALIEVGKSGNGGSLTLGEGVVIRNWGVKIDTTNVGLITIYANASAELDGCEIYGNRIIVQDGFNSSVITNNGTLNIKNGKFMNNILVDGSKYATNRTSVGVTAQPFGKGGFLVCNTGSTTVIDGGEIYSNRAQYGGAIYVNTNATLTLNGGQIYANRGYTSGGAIYLEADTTMTVGSSCEISGNMSGGNSAIVFNDSTQATVTVVDASGTGVSGASAMLMLNSIDEQNQSFVNFALIDGVETTVASDQSVVNMTLLFSGLCLMFVCIVARRFHIKKQRKFSKK